MILAKSVMLLFPFGLAFAQTYSVSGVVTNGVTMQPVKKADVVLILSESEKELRFVTGADGRFQFQVPEGKYRLTAAGPGLPTQGFGARTKPVEIGVSLYVRTGQETDHLQLVIFPPGTIRGKVTDQSGEPVENSLVQVFRERVVAGKKQIYALRTDYTNDRGEYAVGNLAAGTYYLAAAGTPWYTKIASQGDTASGKVTVPSEAFRSVYYPGVFEPAAAAPLKVEFGQEVRANFSLVLTQGRRVRVTCKGTCPSPMIAQLFSEGIGETNLYQNVEWMYPPGPATFASVPVGHYKVRLRRPTGGSGYLGTADLDVGNEDVEVAVPSSESTTISGEVTVDGLERTQLARMILRFQDVTDPGMWFSRNVQADGKFQSPPLLPGRYRILGLGIPNAYVKSVLVDGKEVSAFDVSSDGVKKVTVVASGRPAKVNGTVLSGGKPVYGAIVSLSREGAGREAVDYYRGFQTDSDGSFYFDTLPPGKYRLIAVLDGDFEYANPEALKPYLPEARVIDVNESDSFTEKIEAVAKK